MDQQKRPNHKRRSSSISLTASRSKSLIQERDAQILSLRKEVLLLKNHLVNLKHQQKSSKRQSTTGDSNSTSSSSTNGTSNSDGSKSTPKRAHKFSPYGNLVHEKLTKSGAGSLAYERSRMGRNASIATAEELSSLHNPKEESDYDQNKALVGRILDMFRDPANHMEYLKSNEFARDILKLNAKVRYVFESEPRVVFLQSPAYVFGDIHGNLEDLHFFSDNIWRLGMALTAGNFVFLGDYVDRGMNCLECVAYLFSMKLLMPHKVFLLRGNHETRDVNGWEEHYGERSFIAQCRSRFGDDLGYKVWEQTNQVFDRLPLAAVIDQDIFCVHGGIPRPITETGERRRNRIHDILNVPRVAGINPPYEHEEEDYQQIASDCIWSDPASEDQEKTSVDQESGYGESLRGGGAICFGHKAVTTFLDEHEFSYIMRAHEAHADGVAVSKGGKVFTIFSTSKDHNQGNEALAGCILVDFEQMQVINRSPAYKNQYIHRRDSVSISKLTDNEIEQRMQLGLVTDPSEEDEYEEDEEEEEDDEEEEWGDMDDDDSDSDDNQYTLSNRKSSVDPIHTVPSPHGSSSRDKFEFVTNRGFSCSVIEEEDSSTLNGEDAMDI